MGQPDDGGVDVLFIANEKQRWLVQVKRRQSSVASEGVGTIRNLLGAMLLKEARHGIVVSTADHFTYRAFEAKQKASEIGYILKLIDKGKLDRLIDTLLPNRPWIDFIMTKRPDWVEDFMRQIPDRRQLTFTDCIQQPFRLDRATARQKRGDSIG